MDFYADENISEESEVEAARKIETKNNQKVRQQQVKRAIKTAALAAKRRKSDQRSPSPTRKSNRQSASPYKRIRSVSSSPPPSPIKRRKEEVREESDSIEESDEEYEEEITEREWRRNIGDTKNRRLLRDVRLRVKRLENELSHSPPQPELKRRRGRPPGKLIRTHFASPVKQNGVPNMDGISEVPVYHPSSEQFHDAISYIESIRPDAEKYGMCRIVPPPDWQPECTIAEDLRIIPHNQFIQRLKHKHPPVDIRLEQIKNHFELALKKKALDEMLSKFDNIPTIGGVELDLVTLGDLIKKNGGMNDVMTKNKWSKIAQGLKLHATSSIVEKKLYEAYCTFLISFDGLNHEDQVKCEQNIKDKLKKNLIERNEPIECGKSKSLAEFYKMGQNVSAGWFPNQAHLDDVEKQFWKLVEEADRHVCVQGAHMDSGTTQSAFPTNKSSAFAKHSWNLHALQSNSCTLLSFLDKVRGVSLTSLHLAMMFTASCWQRTPHHLPYIHYIHTGEPTIWFVYYIFTRNFN